MSDHVAGLAELLLDAAHQGRKVELSQQEATDFYEAVGVSLERQVDELREGNKRAIEEAKNLLLR